jgi:hypothetical protein
LTTVNWDAQAVSGACNSSRVRQGVVLDSIGTQTTARGSMTALQFGIAVLVNSANDSNFRSFLVDQANHVRHFHDGFGNMAGSSWITHNRCRP